MMIAHTDTDTVSSDMVQQDSMRGGGATIASTSGGTAVKLLSSSTAIAGTTATVDLVFSTAMKKGAGYIYITDGAVQTVIDRVTQQPTIRIVGATETRKIPVAEVHVSSNHVIFTAEGLTAGHSYSVFMGEGVLTSSTLRPFAGMSKPGAVAVDVLDTTGPSVVAMELSAAVVGSGTPAQLTITFSEPVTTFPGSALEAQNGAIDALYAIGDGTVWVASLFTSGSVASVGNTVALDLAQLRDAAGNAGSGIHLSPAYVVDDGQLPTATIVLADTALSAGETVEVTVTFSEPLASLSLEAFSAPHVSLSAPVSYDGGKTWKLSMAPEAAGLNYSGLKLSLDMSKLKDAAGHAGSGLTLSAEYAVDSRLGSDTEGPGIESISFDGDTLDADHALVATIRFSEAVQDEGLINAIYASHATLSALASSDGGRTWTVKLTLESTDAEPEIGEFGVDLSMVRDLAGNAGSGYDVLPAYAVNTFGSFMFLFDDGFSANDGLVSDDHGRFFGGIFLGEFPDPQASFVLKVGSEQIDNSEIVFFPMDGLLYWYYGGEGSWTEGSHEIVATATKGDGTPVTISKQVEVDGTTPTVVESPASGSAPPPFDIADSLVIQFSEAVYFTGYEPQISVWTTIGSGEPVLTHMPLYPEYLSGDRKTLSIPAGAHHLATGATISLDLPDIEDLAGNPLAAGSISFTTTGTIADSAAPVALGANLEGYDVVPVKTGDTVVFTIDFNESVILYGASPRYVNMNNGGKAYLFGSNMDWTELSFHYVVAPGDGDIEQLGVLDLGSLVNQLKDGAGNILTDPYVDFGALYLGGYGFLEVDQTAPDILPEPAIALASDSGEAGDFITTSNKPVIEGTGAEPGARILIKVGSATIFDYVLADGEGNWTWTPSSAIVAGDHTLSFQQRDRAGNVSEPVSIDVRIEEFGAPALAASSDTGVLDSDGITKDTTPTYSGAGAMAGSTIRLYADEVAVGSTTAAEDGSWSITSSALAAGTYAIVAREYKGGVKTDESAATTLVVDTAGPSSTVASADNDSRSYTLSFDEAIVFAPGGQVGMYQDGSVQKQFAASGSAWTQPSDSQLSFEMGAYSGLFQMQMSTGAIQDLAGNVALIGTPHLQFTLAAPPLTS